MNSCNQKMLMVILSLALAFSFTADCAQIQSQATPMIKVQDPNLRAHSNADDQDPTDMMLAKASSTNVGENQKDDEDDEKDEQDSQSSDENGSKKVKNELTKNLRKQSELTHRIEDLSNEAESDEEVDEAAKQVAKETESAAMGDMLGHMWKDMRMLELPAYTKHVQEELHHLKHEESELEAKLTDDQGKVSADHDEEEKEDDTKKHKEEEETEEDEKEDADEGANGKSVKNAKLREATKEALSEGTKAPMSTQNFWQMSWTQQKAVFLSSLVYVIGGLLFAVLFKQVREKHFVLEQMPESAPNPSAKDFSFHIFGCLAEWKLCVLGFCCPCLAWANTLDRRKGLLSYWPAFFAFFGLQVLNVYTMGIASLFVVALGVYYRQKLREKDGIDSCYSGKKATLGKDILLWCCCQPCAIIQEAREEGVNRTRVKTEQMHCAMHTREGA